MITSFLGMLLTLIGQPLAITPPNNSDIALSIIYQPSLMVASPTGRTSTENYLLHGPVATMRLEIATPHEKTPRQLLQTMQFDTHGYLTNMVLELPGGNGPVAYSFVNQYDAQDRLQQQTFNMSKLQYQPQLTVTVQYTYDDQGRPADLRATLADLADTQRPPLTLQISTTFDDNGRIAKRCWLGGEHHTMDSSLSSAYHYEADGRTVVLTTSDGAPMRNQRQWFDVQGKLVELHTYDEQGHVKTKAFMSYNTQGDPQRISQYSANWAGQWTRITYEDYVYDAHGNWTERSLASLQQKNGKEIRIPEGKQFREITYHPEEPKAE